MTTQGEAGRDAASSEGTVIVTETGAGGYTRQIAAGRHRLVADEPSPVGDDTGPTPYDLALAGLGACTSMTVRMYADRKRWPLEKVQVTLRHSRISVAGSIPALATDARGAAPPRQLAPRGKRPVPPRAPFPRSAGRLRRAVSPSARE